MMCCDVCLVREAGKASHCLCREGYGKLATILRSCFHTRSCQLRGYGLPVASEKKLSGSWCPVWLDGGLAAVLLTARVARAAELSGTADATVQARRAGGFSYSLQTGCKEAG